MAPHRRAGVLALLGLSLALAGCGGRALSWDPPSYTVQEGDTLYSIAFRYGVDYRELARLNGVGSDYLIHPGQVLRLRGEASAGSATAGSDASASRPTSTTRSPRPSSAVRSEFPWRWPVEGELITTFGGADSTAKGIDIGGRRGSEVRAAAGGRVVYAGDGLRGYGRLIILKHDETFISAYGFNRRLHVSEGDQVAAGDRIAEMGEGPDGVPMLHFEIRVDGRAVDPLGLLPDR